MAGYGASAGYGTAQPQQAMTHTPLSAISPYVDTWCIKVRVTRKPDELRTWEANGSRKAGKAGTIDVRDGQGGEIQVSMFNAEADMFWGKFEKDKVYTISGGQIRTAKKQYSGTIDNDYTIVLGRDSKVEFVEDDGTIGQMTYKFIHIAQVAGIKVQAPVDGKREIPKFCDIIAIAHSVSKLEEITSRAGNQFTKRVLNLVDATGQVECTLWNDEAKKFNEDCAGNVFALKACKVSSFNNRSLSAGKDRVAMNPEQAKAKSEELRQWYSENQGRVSKDWPQPMTIQGGTGTGKKTPTVSLADSFNFGQKLLKDEKTGRILGEYFEVLAYPMVITKKNPFYMSCPVDGCMKKVIQNGSVWTCTVHGNQTSCQPRFITRFAVGDHTGQAWMSCFHDQAMEMFNNAAEGKLTPTDIVKLSAEGAAPDPKAYETIFKSPNFIPWIFNCRAKMEEYDGVARRKVVATRLHKPNWANYGKHLIQRIGKA